MQQVSRRKGRLVFEAHPAPLKPGGMSVELHIDPRIAEDRIGAKQTGR
jgi:hypothetical protein